MADQSISSIYLPLGSLYHWRRCPFHDAWYQLHILRVQHRCIISNVGSAIQLGDAEDLRIMLHDGASPNRACHWSEHTGFEFPLRLVTARRHHERTDECFFALLEAGANIQSQYTDEDDLCSLRDQLLLFAFRPNATLRVLEAALDMGIANSAGARERLVQLATQEDWYHGRNPNGINNWTPQDQHLQRQRQRIVLRRVPLSEEQMARFWRGEETNHRGEESPGAILDRLFSQPSQPQQESREASYRALLTRLLPQPSPAQQEAREAAFQALLRRLTTQPN